MMKNNHLSRILYFRRLRITRWLFNFSISMKQNIIIKLVFPYIIIDR